MNVDVTFDHVAPTASLTFTTGLDQGAADESWGIKNFELYYQEIPEIPKPTNFYAAFYSNNFQDSDGWSVVQPYQQ